MANPDESIPAEHFELLDHAAALALAPDASVGELRRLYQDDQRRRVPPPVFNAVLQRIDAI